MVHQHFLLVTFPAQGHLNPTLQFAKRLTQMGVQVTFATGESVRTRMTKIPKDFTFSTFSDGFDNQDMKHKDDGKQFMSDIATCGYKALGKIILSSAHPVTCLVYTLILPWAADVAREYDIPSALLWIQPATVFDIYYYYFNGLISTENDDDYINVPGVSQMSRRDLPSFILPESFEKYKFIVETFRQHIDQLKMETHPLVLVNTFEALETGPLNAIENVNLLAIGPLIPSAFLDKKDPSDSSFGLDLFQQQSSDYIKWLDSKPHGSVIYISFGSNLNLTNLQMEEIASALLSSKRPFLWVIRGDEKPSCLESLQQQGMIVPWCSQLEVLSHPSLAFFMTHCGWNSTLESIVSGLPVVAFPHWTDQKTNAKLIEDVWGVGVRVKTHKEGDTVESSEIQRCIERVFTGEELRRNAKKWKVLACEAVKEGGSSHKNLHRFVQGFAHSLSLV